MLKEGTRYKRNLTIAFVELGSSGERTMAAGPPVDLDMSGEEYAKALAGGIEITRDAMLDAKTMRVRVVALDRNSELAGTVTVAVDRTQ
jgi:hypothetical protein